MVPPSKHIPPTLNLDKLVKQASAILNKLVALEEEYKELHKDSGLSEIHFHEIFMAKLYEKNKKAYTKFFINDHKLKDKRDKEIL